MNTDFLKVLAGVLVVALVTSGLVGGEIADTIGSVATFGLLVVAFSITDERVTELVKMVLRFAFGNVGFLKSLQPTGAASALLAAVVAYAGVKGFDVSIFNKFSAFASLDSDLVSLMTAALTWIGAGMTHSLLPDGVGKAQALK